MQAFYGEVKWSPLDNWTLTGNARHDQIKLDYFAKPVSGNGNVTIQESKTFDANSLRIGLAWTGQKDIGQSIGNSYRRIFYESAMHARLASERHHRI